MVCGVGKPVTEFYYKPIMVLFNFLSHVHIPLGLRKNAHILLFYLFKTLQSGREEFLPHTKDKPII